MITTPDMIKALNRRYPQNKGKWANVIEFQGIDFLSVACWQSLKYVVHGHEIKVSRSDWLRELTKPQKSSKTKPFCDHWWLAAPKGVAKQEEIPSDWGFIEWNGYSFWVIKQAPLLRPPFQRNQFNWDSTIKPAVPNLEHFARKGFAMMARRFAYAQADADALMSGVDDMIPYLDRAALATGRITSTGRDINKEWKKRLQEARKRSPRI